jgi:hypothetical protein
MTVYSRQIENAKRQIKNKGVSVPYTRTVITKNELEPWKSTTAVETLPRILVFLPLNEDDKKTISRLPTTEAGMTFYKALMANQGFEPSKQDKVLFVGKTLSVVDMNILRPDGEIILTTFLFKG